MRVKEKQEYDIIRRMNTGFRPDGRNTWSEKHLKVTDCTFKLHDILSV